jgi:hypothetical protein
MSKSPPDGKQGRGPKPAIPPEWTEAQAALILNLVREKPDATLADIKEALKRRGLLKKRPRGPAR